MKERIKKMTVKELMEILKNYDENAEIILRGGNSTGSYSWAELKVKNDKINQCCFKDKYEIIMEYED